MIEARHGKHHGFSRSWKVGVDTSREIEHK